MILKYKVDIGTDDGVLAELKSVIDVNPMNSTFVNQRINLQFDTCYEDLLYSFFCSLDHCKYYQLHWAIACRSPQLCDDSMSNLSPPINSRLSLPSLEVSVLSAQFVPSTISIRNKYFCLRGVSNHNDTPFFLG